MAVNKEIIKRYLNIIPVDVCTMYKYCKHEGTNPEVRVLCTCTCTVQVSSCTCTVIKYEPLFFYKQKTKKISKKRNVMYSFLSFLQ